MTNFKNMRETRLKPSASRSFLTSVTLLIVLITVSICCILPLRRSSAAAGSLCHARCSINGIPMQVITVNLKDRSLLVTPVVSLGPPKKQKSFTQFQQTHHPLAQVTGTFFDITSGFPVGDIVVHGKKVCKTQGIGSALVIKYNNEAAMLDEAPEKGWKSYESVIQGGLRLVRDGYYALDPEGQGFRDQYMQRCTSRIVVGLCPNNRLVMVKTGEVMLPQLAYAMIELGCQDAMALDGGASSAMSFRGKFTSNTQRRLSNVLMVIRRNKPSAAPRVKPAPEKQTPVPGISVNKGS